MSYENWGRRANTDSQVEVYSPDGGTTFNWHYADGDDWRLGGWNYTDPALAIEAAWSWLNAQGGGVLRTRGPGETWTVQTSINSQGSDVTWLSDWSLCIQAMAGLDERVVRVTAHDRVVLNGLYIDGNKGGGGWGVGTFYYGIEFYQSDHSSAHRCRVDNCRIFGIMIHESTHIEVSCCDLDGNRWNGIGVHHNCSDIWIHHNDVSESSDVGISVDAPATDPTTRVWIHDNDVWNIDNAEGTANSHYGVSTENSAGGDAGVADVFIYDNCIWHIEVGILVDSPTIERVYIDRNCVWDWDFDDTGNVVIHVQGINCTVHDNKLIYTGEFLGPQGVYLNGAKDAVVTVNIIRVGQNAVHIQLANVTDDSLINNNKFLYGAYGIDINAGCNNNQIGPGNDYTGVIIISGGLVDDGTDTEMPCLTLSFVEGTMFLSADGAAWGWEIDLATEYAIALGTLPTGVDHVVRWRIWATSLVAEADEMRLRIDGYGGADNEPFSQETVAIASHPSESTNFAVDDVVYWEVDAGDDEDVDDMRGDDQIMIKVQHAVAADDDCETDAVFTNVQVFYV